MISLSSVSVTQWGLLSVAFAAPKTIKLQWNKTLLKDSKLDSEDYFFLQLYNILQSQQLILYLLLFHFSRSRSLSLIFIFRDEI
jgi:hypothetical protein